MNRESLTDHMATDLRLSAAAAMQRRRQSEGAFGSWSRVEDVTGAVPVVGGGARVAGR